MPRVIKIERRIQALEAISKKDTAEDCAADFIADGADTLRQAMLAAGISTRELKAEIQARAAR